MSKYRVLYLDLNYPDLVEDYSLTPKRYGGGAIIARHLMPWMNQNGYQMDIAANPLCFDNVEEKYKDNCIALTDEQRADLRDGASFYSTLPDVAIYDIILHNFHGVKLNLRGSGTKDLIWLVGYGEHVHHLNRRIVLYNGYQGTICHPEAKVYKARIGVPLPKFQKYETKGYIFSAHRQNLEFGAKIMCRLAHKYRLNYITAGPLDKSFDIMQYVDNKYVTYLGVINAEEKAEMYKHAYCSTHIHSWKTPMSLGAVESLSYGCPCIATNIGFWPSLITNWENGFILNSNNDEDFLDLLENCSCISQEKCYNSVRQYDSSLMISDYIKVFEEVLKE